MAHRRSTKYFSRKFNARKALLRGLMVSLVEHGRIKTTVEKAKELRRHIEPAITLGKKGLATKEAGLATRRLLLSRIPNQDTVERILTDISPRFKTRAGGYTRIIKIGRRPGDTAEMAFIEFVDYDFKGEKVEVIKEKKTAKSKAKAEGADTVKAAKATKAKTAKKVGRLVAAKKKGVRKIQSKARAASRG